MTTNNKNNVIVSVIQEKTKIVLRPVYKKKVINKLSKYVYDFDHYEIYGKVIEEINNVKEYHSTPNTNITWQGAVFTSLMNSKLNKNAQNQKYLILDKMGKKEILSIEEIPFLVENIGEMKPKKIKDSCTCIKDTYIEEANIQIFNYKDGTLSFAYDG